SPAVCRAPNRDLWAPPDHRHGEDPEVRAAPAGPGAVTQPSFPGLVPGLRGERKAMVTRSMATTHAGGPGVLMAAWMLREVERAFRPMRYRDNSSRRTRRMARSRWFSDDSMNRRRATFIAVW